MTEYVELIFMYVSIYYICEYVMYVSMLEYVNFFFLEPYAGPGILEAYTINSTSLFVRWNKEGIPEDKWNGIPRSFAIHGGGTNCTGWKIHVKYVSLNVSSFIVTNLTGWIVYKVRVSGVTTPGIGRASEKIVQTNDSGTTELQG